MKTLGTLLAVAWLVSTIVFLANGMIPAAVICTGAVSLLALALSRKAKDVTRERCFCFFGGLIVCIFLSVLSVEEEFSWGLLCQSLFAAGICSVPLVICEPISRRHIGDYLRQTVHRPSLEGTPEGCAQGLIVWIIVTGIAIFLALVLGFWFVTYMFLLSLSALISMASNPFKQNSLPENSEPAPADNAAKQETQNLPVSVPIKSYSKKTGPATPAPRAGSVPALNKPPEEKESKEEDLNITWL